MAEFCLNLICPPAVEEKLLDRLLANAGSELFTSTHTHCHGAAPNRLSDTEQVMGRSHAVQVQVLLTDEEWDHLRTVLQRDFAGAGLRYWATPVAFEGVFA